MSSPKSPDRCRPLERADGGRSPSRSHDVAERSFFACVEPCDADASPDARRPATPSGWSRPCTSTTGRCAASLACSAARRAGRTAVRRVHRDAIPASRCRRVIEVARPGRRVRQHGVRRVADARRPAHRTFTLSPPIGQPRSASDGEAAGADCGGDQRSPVRDRHGVRPRASRGRHVGWVERR